MKKNLLFLFAFILTAGLTFSSCSDDKNDGGEPPLVPTWEDFVGTYSGDNLSLPSSYILAPEGIVRSIEVSKSTTADKAKITLKNLLPEGKEVVLDGVTINKSDAGIFSFQGVDTYAGTTVTVTGTFAGSVASAASVNGTRQTEGSAKKLTVSTIARKINSAVAGSWIMDPATALSARAYSSDEGYNEDLQSLPALISMFSPLLASKVENVKVNLSEDGIFTFNWTPVDGQPTDIYDILGSLVPEGVLPIIRGALKFEYYEDGGKLYIGINKAILDLMTSSMPEGSIPFDLSLIIGLMNDNGSYYVLPLNSEIEGGNATFFMEKDFLAKVLPLVKEFVDEDASIMGIINIWNIIDEFIEIMNDERTEQFDLILTFNPAS